MKKILLTFVAYEVIATQYNNYVDKKNKAIANGIKVGENNGTVAVAINTQKKSTYVPSVYGFIKGLKVSM